MVSCSSRARSWPPTRATHPPVAGESCTRSRAWPARAVSSSAASMAASSRGASSTRPADVREVSTTMTMRRCCSGCQVRTTRCWRRAVARQSMLRTSSPSTYSRRLSNSVPCPRVRSAARPSSWRRTASRLGRCLRAGKGCSVRSVPGTSTDCWRAASPSGPVERTVTWRRGAVAPAGRAQRGDEPGALARRQPSAVCRGSSDTGRGRPAVAQDATDPAPTGVGHEQGRGRLLAEPHLAGPLAADGSERGGGASRTSSPTSTRQPSTHQRTVAACGHTATGTSPSRTSATAR